jgi:DNA-binding protein
MTEQQQGDVVLIGKKPTMNYVVACLTLFNSGKQTVTVRARGFVISHAIDTVELLRRAFIKNLEVQKITIGSQEFQKDSGVYSSISTIDIVISRSRE